MGITASTPTPVAELDTPVTSEEHDSEYKWPANLYLEMRDMAGASFLVYTFGYINDVARKTKKVVGLQVNDQTGRTQRGSVSSSFTTTALSGSFTPADVVDIVKNNQAVLAAKYDKFNDQNLPSVLRSLQVLQSRVDEYGMERPLTLQYFDDRHQEHEMVYAVAKDDINKRVTLVFRGTHNELTSGSNWTTNMYVSKTQVDIPSYLKDKVDAASIWWHSGFYNYIFEQTFDPNDSPDRTKITEIIEDIKPLLEANPDYKLYVTGHSLGGALAGLVSFYLACDPEIPKPVTCFSFGAPRFGDSNYLEALQVLEKHEKLRFCRVVNDNDSVAAVPMWNYYHGGFQVRLYKDTSTPAEITFPKIEDANSSRWGRAWSNSLIMSLNFGYDHGAYQKRVDMSQAYLESEDLIDLYQKSELTGF